LKILNGPSDYEWQHQQGSGGKIMLNLHELTFYINKTETGNNDYFKQTNFPLKDCLELDIQNIVSVVQNSQNLFLSNINLVGNIFTYTHFNSLIDFISYSEFNFTIIVTIEDMKAHIKDLKKINWPENVRFNVLITSILEHQLVSLSKIKACIFVTLLVCTEKEYNKYLDEFVNIPVYEDAHIIPLFIGCNEDFFKEVVYTNIEDIDEIILQKREIFMHQTLNASDFGKLTIFPDGFIYGNVNMEPLGTVKEYIYSLVYKEFTEGGSWFRIRNMEPCLSCIYQWLCPSPSNYELVIGKPNLCKIVS
jgi:pseudo-rSAM protein